MEHTEAEESQEIKGRDDDLRRNIEKMFEVTRNWKPLQLRTKIKRTELVIAINNYLMSPYNLSGTRASATTADTTPLIMVEFPDDQAFNSILSGIEEDIDRSAIDDKALREDLRIAFLAFQFSAQLDSSNTTTKRYQRLVEIKKAAHRLRKLLAVDLEEWRRIGIDWITYSQDPSVTKLVEGEDPETRAMRILAAIAEAKQRPVFKYAGLVLNLEDLIEEAEFKAKQGFRTRVDCALTPKDNLVQGALKDIYEKHIARCVRTKRNRKRTEQEAPFVRFAHAVLTVMGIDVDLDTIQRDYRHVKKTGKSRRKQR